MINDALLTNLICSFQTNFTLLHACGTFCATFIGRVEEIENSSNMIGQISFNKIC